MLAWDERSRPSFAQLYERIRSNNFQAEGTSSDLIHLHEFIGDRSYQGRGVDAENYASKGKAS